MINNLKVRSALSIVCSLFLSVGIMAGCSNKTSSTTTSTQAVKTDAKELTTDEVIKLVDNKDYVFVDTREDSYFNGFKEEGAKKGGHIKNAVQFTSTWVDKINKEKLTKFVSDKGIAKDKKIVVYSSKAEETANVASMLKGIGYNDVSVYNKINELGEKNESSIVSFKRFDQLVNAKWVKEALEGKKPENMMSDKPQIFEVSWGPEEKSKDYNSGHIKGAVHFNTDWIENEPVWNLSAPEVAQKNLEAAGINEKSSVILYSSNIMAAGRVYYALKVYGVKDVRILNGGLDAWKAAGYEVSKEAVKPVAAKFEKPITIDRSIDIEMAKEAMEKKAQGLKLVSNRAWDEYTGKISGYDYIKGLGEPNGAIWGFAGTDSQNMADYIDPDGTLRNPEEMVKLWEGQGIKMHDKVAFYCGTGWRSTLPFEMTQMLGWDEAVMYDGGWNEWQMHPEYPVQKSAPNNMEKPDAKNDYK